MVQDVSTASRKLVTCPGGSETWTCYDISWRILVERNSDGTVSCPLEVTFTQYTLTMTWSVREDGYGTWAVTPGCDVRTVLVPEGEDDRVLAFLARLRKE
jgi:hypothetical protein